MGAYSESNFPYLSCAVGYSYGPNGIDRIRITVERECVPVFEGWFTIPMSSYISTSLHSIDGVLIIDTVGNTDGALKRYAFYCFDGDNQLHEVDPPASAASISGA